MILINNNFNLLSEEEETLLNNKCNNFFVTHKPNINQAKKIKNYYYGYKFNLEEFKTTNIPHKIIRYIKSLVAVNDISILGVWINKINDKSNKDDDFHKDYSDLTFLLYLNEDFNGGEFEYINEKKTKIKIKPKKNLSIIIDNKIQHRVLPVISGVRFSLVMFFQINKKRKLTLI